MTQVRTITPRIGIHRAKLMLSVAALPILTASASAHAQLAAPPATAPSQAPAPSAPGATVTGVGDIIVTAQRRAENIQKVPLSIAAVSGEALTSAGITNVTQLQKLVPSLRFEQNAQAAGVAVKIRGIGSNSNSAVDSSVASYIDGVFIPRPGAVIASFLDVQSVEVLRGPQGTLFGRNSTVGAISLHSNAPSFAGNSGEASVEAGNYNTFKGQAVGNIALSDDVAVRAAFLGSTTGGYYYSVPTDQRFGAKDLLEGRVSLKARVTSRLTWTGRVDYARTTGDGVFLSQPIVSALTPAQITNFATRTGTPVSSLTGPSFDAYQRFDSPSLHDTQLGISSDLAWDTGSGFSIRLIDSYRRWKSEQQLGDTIFTPLDLLNSNLLYDSKSQSHELQLISPKDRLLGGRLDFVVGLYYFAEHYNTGETFDLGSQFCSFVYGALAPSRIARCQAGPQTAATNLQFRQYEHSEAVYTQANLKLTSKLIATVGGRYTWEDKSGSYNQVVSNPLAGAGVLRAPEVDALQFSDSRPNWRASLAWQVDPTVLAFFTYSTGFKSGGFNNAGGPSALTVTNRTFSSETSSDYELGVKSTFFQRRLLLNVDLFQTELYNFQEKTFNGLGFVIRNAGNIRARGIEMEGQYRIVDPLRLEFGVSYLDSIYTSNHNAPGLPGCTGAIGSCPTVQDLTGRRSLFAPSWQINGALEYDTSLFSSGWNAQLRGSVNYMSSYFTLNDNNPQSVLGNDTILGARLTFVSPGKTWTVAIYGDNLTNHHYFTATSPQPLDTLFGVRVPATGASLIRGYLAAPLTFGLRIGKKF